MTPKQSRERLALYVAGAVVATAAAGIMSVDWNDPRHIAVFVLAIAGSIVNSWRAFIDTSSSQVIPPDVPGQLPSQPPIQFPPADQPPIGLGGPPKSP